MNHVATDVHRQIAADGTGHHRNGVVLAAITAELLAEASCSEASAATQRWLQAFRWDRFNRSAAPGAG